MTSLTRLMLAFLIALPLASGCGAKRATDAFKQVTVAELGNETDHLPFFSYVGSDDELHYFRTSEGKRYKVHRSEVSNLGTFGVSDGLELFVTIKDGKVTVPDPKMMAGLSQEELHKPYKKKQK
jgi:hypothetical protein